MRGQAVSSLKWTTVSQASRLGSQLLAVIILARLLPPLDFGLIAMAAVVTGFVGLLRDFGTSAAIIQKSDPSPRLLDSVFWLNVSFGAGLALVLGLLSPLIAYGFAEPRLKEVLWALTLTFPIVSLGAAHQALLEKASRFRSLAIIESAAAFMGLGGAVWAAWIGWGVYSLVMQALIVAFLTTAGLWIVSRWRPAFRWDTSEIRSVMGFSGNLAGFNVINYFIRNADNLLIGRFLGATDLGYYSMAYKLMLLPLQNISSVMGRALFPVFSKVQADDIAIGRVYLGITQAIALVTAPLMFGFFVLRDLFVTSVLGDKWQPVAGLLTWLVPIGLLQSIGTMVGLLYLAKGRTDVMLKWGIFAGVVVVSAFIVGMQWGVKGVAAAYFVASLLLFWPSLAVPFRFVQLKVVDVVRCVMPSVMLAAIMALVVAAINAMWTGSIMSQTGRLVVLIFLGAGTYFILSIFIQRALLNDIVRAIFKR